jgi:hypothetical protein
MRPVAILFAAFYCGLVASPPQAEAKPGACPAGMVASHSGGHRCVAAAAPVRQSNRERQQLRAQDAQESSQPQQSMMPMGGGY